MPPNSADRTNTGVLFESDAQTPDGGLDRDTRPLKQGSDLRPRYIWPNIVSFTIAHMFALYGLTLLGSTCWQTLLFAFAMENLTILGITAGAHRLWTHRAYKARLPLRILLAVLCSISHQNSIIHWCRDHRVHHKFSETNADPSNSSRGFFFAHMGWLIERKHPECAAKGRTIDISDLLADPVLVFQRRYYVWCTLAMSVVGPLLLPVYGWDESWTNAWCVSVMLRWVVSLHGTWLVNSAAHMFGTRPYDATLNPAENPAVSLLALGEGFHNFHHAFPWDYKTSELGNVLNPTAWFLDGCARIGWAYDLKMVSPELVHKRMERTGDGTVNVWGWGDKEQKQTEREAAKVLYRK